MIPRHLSPHILKYSKQYPIVALVGPRQSGKTTLAKELFPNYKYISLENLDLRHQASSDTRGFLNDCGPFVIFDEVQRVPELFHYLQELVDTNQNPAQYILTGSSQFLLIEKITQSLAGRIVTFKLYPLTYTELHLYPQDANFESVFKTRHLNRERLSQEQLLNLIWTGFYPRIHDKHLDSYKWHENYLLTYVERDVRSLLNIRNLRTFENFLKLVASQSGQLMNYSNLANSIGISLPAVKEWISLLETSGLIFTLPPYFENFSKRIVKTPKLFFVDTGLLCYLLSIRTIEQLKTHPQLGSIFETFIVSECFKRFYNLGEIPPLYFWRDQSGNEIDLLIYDGQKGYPIEIKLSQTFHSDFNKTINKWLELKNNIAREGSIIYCGEHAAQTSTSIPAIPWSVL
ncbi:MAG: ATP-binding protein [Candidatus Protochlamydia sp.]|nr:ATP-binding protein [Candidatus Protochlamydia sp.]